MKRASEHQLTKDNADLDPPTDHATNTPNNNNTANALTSDPSTEEDPANSFQKASAEVIAKRRIIRARRTLPSSTPPSSFPSHPSLASPSVVQPPVFNNPFATLNTHNNNNSSSSPSSKPPSLPASQALDNTAVNTPLSFGSLSSSAAPVLSFATAADPSAPSLSFGTLAQATSSKTSASTVSFGAAVATTAKAEAASQFKEEKVETGEEHEKELFRTRVKLYTLESSSSKSSTPSQWKERGVGILKINQNRQTHRARLLMRTEATLRLLLNTPLFQKFGLDKASDRSLRFHGLDVDSLALHDSKCFLVRFSTKDLLNSFVHAVDQWKQHFSKTSHHVDDQETNDKPQDDKPKEEDNPKEQPEDVNESQKKKKKEPLPSEDVPDKPEAESAAAADGKKEEPSSKPDVADGSKDKDIENEEEAPDKSD